MGASPGLETGIVGKSYPLLKPQVFQLLKDRT